ncbi:uncharacterized protein LOC131677322 [Topomyia yanbarensis]|uniref:uncharacterized protein LOC131677322 n=1 Tax=Topomyia yanbarensis TaxID=2498891 RepID=UPI00273C71E6|nr:uncharacterized protein LOC131677322 [Topomyia yanbarensis]
MSLKVAVYCCLAAVAVLSSVSPTEATSDPEALYGYSYQESNERKYGYDSNSDSDSDSESDSDESIDAKLTVEVSITVEVGSHRWGDGGTVQDGVENDDVDGGYNGTRHEGSAQTFFVDSPFELPF